MSYLPFALISYFLNSVAVTIDKILLTRVIPDPVVYIFYFSLISCLALLVLPFTHIPSIQVIAISSLSTILWTAGAYLMFKALKIGLLQRVIPIIGVITPVTLLLLATADSSITRNQSLSVIVLILGLIFLTIRDWKGRFIKKELALDVGAGLLFALSYYFLRMAYLKDDFLTVLAWSRLILIPLAIIFLLSPRFRTKSPPILNPLFIFGQISAGVSELLLSFSISLANPVLVNALQGVKYVYLLFFGLILDKKYPKIYQILGVTLIGIGLYLLQTSLL